MVLAVLKGHESCFLVDLATGSGERGEDIEWAIISVVDSLQPSHLDSAIPVLDGADPLAKDVFVDHVADFARKAEEGQGRRRPG